MRKIVQLAGTSGSGKSTGLKWLFDRCEDKVFIEDAEGRGINATWLKSAGILVLGHYRVDCGGCDMVTGNGGLARANETLRHLLQEPQYVGIPIFFEGLLMASFVNVKRLVSIIQEEEPDAEYIIIHCSPPEETCIQRVYVRNGGKPFNHDPLTGRYRSLQRGEDKFRALDHVKVIHWDNSDVLVEEMWQTIKGLSGMVTTPIVSSRHNDNDMEQIFWEFVHARQAIFYARIQGLSRPWSEDEILNRYKFTNVFRASDRVSQYLIRNVSYNYSQEPEEIIFRTLLFKIFNLESTWEYILRTLGTPTIGTFDMVSMSTVLNFAGKIFNNAYMMGGYPTWGFNRKHWNLLKTMEVMIEDGILAKIAAAPSLRYVYELLLPYPLMGKFVAMQYAIDINYGAAVDFDEDEFIQLGPGALRGMVRIFSLSREEVLQDGMPYIRRMTEQQPSDVRLFGRPLHLIDVQNLCCEFDKYCRAKFPDEDMYGKKRIKEKYTPSDQGKVVYWFPPKWGINEAAIVMMEECDYIR